MTLEASEPWASGPPEGFGDDPVDAGAEEAARHFADLPHPSVDPSPANGPAWPEPDPFGAVDLPAFPVDTLSPWQKEWARAESDFTQTPLDLPGLLALTAASLPISRGVGVRVRDGWIEPTNIWTVVALSPGERKSPEFAAAVRPILQYQTVQADKLAPEIAEYQSTKRILEGKIRAAEAAAIKGKKYQNGSPEEAIRDLSAELLALPVISAPVLIADDVTPEAVARVLSENSERLGIFSAEGGPFEMMNGRYSDKGPNLEIWLKSHPGDSHTVHRIGRPPISLEKPLTTIAITCQPSVISGLAKREGFRGRGLLARFIFALPLSKMGKRDVNPDAVPDATRTAYAQAMCALLTYCTTPRILTMSEGADHARIAFATELEPLLGLDGTLFPIGDWAAKLVGLVARVAGILHVSDHAHDIARMPLEIQPGTWQRAQTIGAYALEHARSAFDSMGSDEPDELAKRLWAWVRRKSVVEFTERDACRALTAKADELGPALERLTQRHLIRLRPTTPTKPKPGRPPAPTYDVNPRAAQ